LKEELAMSTGTVPPGWHPDPSNPGGAVRWWDGSSWTAHTQLVPTASPYGSPSPTPYSAGAYGPAEPSFAKRNSKSLTALGVVAVYIVLALSTGIVFIGILPVLMAVRATKRKEQLAPVAIIAAVIAVGVALLAFT
jgi:Protein of unknown function (DUF2510)